MTHIIKHCRGKEKQKRRERKLAGFRKKLGIPESEISKSSQTRTQIKTRKNVCKRKST